MTVTDAHRTAGRDAARQLVGMPLGHAGTHLAQVIADADEAGYQRAQDGWVYCPDCGAELDDWRGHRTDPPCHYDPDATPEETTP